MVLSCCGWSFEPLMLNAVLFVVSCLTVLVALVPIAMAGGRALNAAKNAKPVWPWVGIGLLCLLMLAVTAAVSLLGLMTGLFPRFVFTLNGGDLLPALLASLLTLAGPWLVWLLARGWAHKSSLI
jgi:hypothetical protein